MLSRVRKQARAVGCQANLRQWGLLFSTELTANDGEMVFFPFASEFTEADRDWRGFCFWPQSERRYGPQIHDLLLCPMASRVDYAYKTSTKTGWPAAFGGTFSAYWIRPPNGKIAAASYGFNGAVAALSMGNSLDWPRHRWPNIWPLWPNIEPYPHTDRTPSLASIPLMFDCSDCGVQGFDKQPPPPFESLYVAPIVPLHWSAQCINRHDGGVNYLFLDWSVRKVGLKELWTLKWDPLFDTCGPWTRAGGVRPEDWPQWLRRFKAY